MDAKRKQDKADGNRRRSVAIVSGKGGSGKTVLTATIASVFNELKIPATIIDADTGTAGMSYFLGVREAEGKRSGLTDLLDQQAFDASIVARLTSLPSVGFIGIGNHLSLYDGHHTQSVDLVAVLTSAISELTKQNWVLVDCRGGIDEQSLGVCRVVDDILIVAEADTTSYQATRLLIDVLIEKKLKAKVRGFVINKVIYNPIEAVKAAKGFYGVPYLFSFPLDLDVTAKFVQGRLPSLKSQFSIHVWEALHRLYKDDVSSPKGRVWKNWEFREIGVVDRESSAGGFLITLCLVIAATLFFRQSVPLVGYFGEQDPEHRIAALIVVGTVMAGIGLVGSLQKARKFIGQGVLTVARWVRSLLGYDREA